MDYTQLTPDQRQQMLDAIGVEKVEDLYASLPEPFRLRQPVALTGLPRGLSELELQRELYALAGANRVAGVGACFMGGGAYDHFIPSVVDALAGKGEFVTAYTPYQAEASQGSLQAFFEFQSQVCRLSGMDIANASLYEGATAAAEAVLMALNTTGRRRVLVAATLHPHYRAVIQTYLTDLPATYVELPADPASGAVLPATVRAAIAESRGDAACVVIQSPNVFGIIEDWSAHFAAAHEAGPNDPSSGGSGTLGVAVFNPIACGLLKRPGDCGADIAAAEGQPLGIPMQLGGPYLGLFAAKQALLRRMPGRLVGQTVDAEGRRGFCLTLQTREQHIRGAKATSNVCTNQGLMAMRATVFMTAMGPAGLRQVAEQCYHKAHYAAGRLAALPGFSMAHRGAFFHEFVLNCPKPAARIIDAGRARSPAHGIFPGIDCAKLGIGSANQLLVTVTEKRTRAEIDVLVELCASVR